MNYPFTPTFAFIFCLRGDISKNFGEIPRFLPQREFDEGIACGVQCASFRPESEQSHQNRKNLSYPYPFTYPHPYPFP